MNGQFLVITVFVIGMVLLYGWRHSPTILGRSRRRIALALHHIPSLLYFYTRALFTVRRPFSFVRSHINRRPIPGREVKFRSGIRMCVSHSPDDAATLFCIFVKRDYGQIRPGSVVVDIGANIGAFSVYALQSGARRVCAFEPSEESFELLQRNLQVNGFGSRATCHLKAVSNISGREVLFPKASDPSNLAVEDGDPTGLARVTTISLPDIIRMAGIDRVDYLKLDCEGSEYPIILESDSEVWPVIQDIRVEYHLGDEQKLIEKLRHSGFSLRRHAQTSNRIGHLWFTRSAAATHSIMPLARRGAASGVS